MTDMVVAYLGWNSSSQGWNGGTWGNNVALPGSTASVGAVTVVGTAVQPVTGLTSTASVGAVTVTGTASVAVTGIAATGSPGATTVVGTANLTLQVSLEQAKLEMLAHLSSVTPMWMSQVFLLPQA